MVTLLRAVHSGIVLEAKVDPGQKQLTAEAAETPAVHFKLPKLLYAWSAGIQVGLQR
jgi:hypothetical protein